MTARRLACAVVLVLLAAVAGATEVSYLSTIPMAPLNAPWVCTRPSGNKVRCTSVRLIGPSPTPEPTRSPTPSPKPTTPPLPCEPIGGIKTYQVGEEKMLCFTVPTPGDAPFLLEISVRNYGNASCGELEAELRSPSGGRSYSLGPQPNVVLKREPGKWHLWTKLTWGCNTYGFTVK